ncbi:MAG: DUF2284 domain-containing protein [Promethearchaeati archaeon SRVP18_Atabeyarchaeia-1]
MHPGKVKDSEIKESNPEEDASIVRIALDLGVTDARLITPDQVVVASWVRLKCQFGCPSFASTLICPPFTPPADEVRRALSEYSKILALRFDQAQIQHARNSKEFASALSGRQKTVNEITTRIERELLLKGYYKAFALPPSRCSLCAECALRPGKCQHPMQVRPMPESLSIDVFQTVRNIGWSVEVKTDPGQSWASYGLILVE